MTDINTAALRASLERRGVIGALRTYDLCDALDAARAELKVVKDFKDYMLAHDPGPFVTELEERAEAAEARIAAALALVGGDCNECNLFGYIRRALTGDTT